MVKLSEKSRRVLRRIYQGLGAATVSILFQACYGMPIDDSITISGIVNSKADVPIPGIRVSVEDLSSSRFTNEDGIFNIYVPRQASYKLQFKDVDGPANGSYKTLNKTVKLSDTNMTLQIQLDEADEE